MTSDQSTAATQPQQPEPEIVSLRAFLETYPAGVKAAVSALANVRWEGGSYYLKWPEPIRLQCWGESCDGERMFSPTRVEMNLGPGSIALNEPHEARLAYTCRDCRTTTKRYALLVTFAALQEPLLVWKYGEIPAFKVHVSRKLRELLRNDKDLLEKALAAESTGLGIGAFVYYRRILERQKEAIFDRVISAAKKLDAGPVALRALEKAKHERQFTAALDALGSGPLKAIYLNGHNPLTLLYDEISEGVHAGSDEENLSSAKNVRVVLMHLADSLSEVLAERMDVEAAVADLLKNQRGRREQQRKPEAASPEKVPAAESKEGPPAPAVGSAG